VWNVHAGFASDNAGSFSERHAVAELDKMDDITVVPWIPLVAEKAFDPVPRSRCVFFATVRIDDGDLRCTAVAHDLHAPLDDFEGSWVGKLLEAMSIDLSSARTSLISRRISSMGMHRGGPPRPAFNLRCALLGQGVGASRSNSS